MCLKFGGNRQDIEVCGLAYGLRYRGISHSGIRKEGWTWCAAFCNLALLRIVISIVCWRGEGPQNVNVGFGVWKVLTVGRDGEIEREKMRIRKNSAEFKFSEFEVCQFLIIW